MEKDLMHLQNKKIAKSMRNPTSDNHSHMNDDEVLPELHSGENTQTTCTFPVLSNFQPSQIDDDSLHSLVRSLINKQCDAYKIVLKWCRDKVKSLNSEIPYETAHYSFLHYCWCWSWKKSCHEDNISDCP